MPRRKLADRIGQFIKDVDKYLICAAVLQANVRAGEAGDARARLGIPELAGEALAVEKKILADGRPLAEALEACGENASSVLAILHHVAGGYGGDGGAAADAVRPSWRQWKIELQRTAMRLSRGDRPSAAGGGKRDKPPLTPDAAVRKSIAQRVWSSIKAAYGFTVEKVAKGTTDSITKRP